MLAVLRSQPELPAFSDASQHEAPQVTLYEEGDFYATHLDYSSRLIRGHVRLVTFLVFLRAPSSGGHLAFPKLTPNCGSRLGTTCGNLDTSCSDKISSNMSHYCCCRDILRVSPDAG